MSPVIKRMLLGAGVLGAGGLACVLALVAFFFFIQPRRVIARYDRFVETYPVGASVETLVADPFVRDATMVTLNGEVVLDDGTAPKLDDLRSKIQAKPTGELHIMWTHTPPFGRVNVTITFSAGKIASVRQGSLD